MPKTASTVEDPIKAYGLEGYVRELETDGITVLPPEATGITDSQIDRCVEVLLDRFTQLTGGCPISLESGPGAKLDWPAGSDSVLRPKEDPEPSQMLIQQLLQLDRSLRNLCVNPVVDALIGHLVGPLGTPARPARNPARGHRLSSVNSFVKWQGEYGYGESLGLHCDQGANPLPWGNIALTANATWCLTDYSKSNGALAYVPGSHKANAHPDQPRAASIAVAAEAPRGSCIIFPGSTWHGAFPKLTEGVRLNAVAYYRHHSVLPQENMRVTLRDAPWEDCDDPDLMRELIGFDDTFPYEQQSFPVPTLAKRLA